MIYATFFDSSRRIPVILAMMVSLNVVLLLLNLFTKIELSTSLVLLFIAGLTLYGPHIMMSTTIPMDFYGSHGTASVAGFIDGLGYLGMTFSDPFVGWIVDIEGWEGAKRFWVISSLFATSSMLILWRMEVKKDQEGR